MRVETTTTVFYSESDVLKILNKHLKERGLRLIGDFEVIVKSKNDIPQGASAGDQLGIKATVQVNDLPFICNSETIIDDK